LLPILARAQQPPDLVTAALPATVDPASTRFLGTVGALKYFAARGTDSIWLLAVEADGSLARRGSASVDQFAADGITLPAADTVPPVRLLPPGRAVPAGWTAVVPGLSTQ
jgi:hypothetical protein